MGMGRAGLMIAVEGAPSERLLSGLLLHALEASRPYGPIRLIWSVSTARLRLHPVSCDKGMVMLTTPCVDFYSVCCFPHSVRPKRHIPRNFTDSGQSAADFYWRWHGRDYGGPVLVLVCRSRTMTFSKGVRLKWH